MSESALSPDREERLTALDPSRSFIVQAPAGSGKTELLIQRYLVLLSTVQRPEEIAAITFTRKAAAEMKKRVLQALISARTSPQPDEPHEALTWQHARRALDQDVKLGWGLQESAARLRIQTIDSLSASLTRQMPVLSRFGVQPESVEDAGALYQEAARNTLALLEQEDQTGADVAAMLSHLDNNTAIAEDLLAGMLARRDRWLRHLRDADNRESLEVALARIVREALSNARALLPENFANELLALADYSAQNLAQAGTSSPIHACAGLTQLPGADEASIEGWTGIAELLLTKTGDWRKTVNVSHGFPPGKDKDARARAQHFKERHAALVADLSAVEAFGDALALLRILPPVRYSEEQWQVLGSIARLLPRAVAELKLVFAGHGQVDFVEIAQGALMALGTEEVPTDLLLSLDYRIRHILVDEFQDTSLTQFELLKLLTSGWQPDDGRTLFVVGDPMQSIYRFREAEVGLFLKARQQGIGTVELEPLTLSANFRSQAGIVEWVNGAFSRIMPQAESVTAGAVPYTRSEAVHAAHPDAVQMHAFFDADADVEAVRVVALIRAAQARNPKGTIAVLVRGRSHLQSIVPHLKRSELRFRAIEIEPLGHRQVVQDLLALTRALSHAADRSAWLAVLRAPWCGLTLADLAALAEGDFVSTVRDSMENEERVRNLSADGRWRLARAGKVIGRCIGQRCRASLRETVEGAWLALGGPACVEHVTDLEDAEIFLQYLEDAEEAGAIADLVAFEDGLAKLFAMPDLEARDTDPQILTIHKAKGLEFDTVIVPGLGRRPRHAEPSLFLWTRRLVADSDGSAELLLAPIRRTGVDADPIYHYLARLDRERERYEQARLLYVASTRAKQHLHLLGHAIPDNHDGVVELRSPARDSLLETLWPAVGGDFRRAAALLLPEQLLNARSSPRDDGAGMPDQDLRRLPAEWSLPNLPPAVYWTSPQDEARVGEEVEFSWAGETARHVGSVVHRWLQRIAEDEMKGWDRARLEKLRKVFRDELGMRGIPETDIDVATTRIVFALGNSLEDARGRWLLGPQQQARNEFRITALIDGERRNFVIDRTFVDQEGKRRIVDYKTGSREGADIEGFLDQERERYRQQLEHYALAFGAGESNLGLYFPLLSGWREWESGQ